MSVFKTTVYRLSKSTLFWFMTIGVSCLFIIGLLFLGGTSQSKICRIAIADNDQSVASKTFIEMLRKNYNVVLLLEEELEKMLIDQQADVAIIINEEFGSNLQNGIAPQIDAKAFAYASYLDIVKLSANEAIKTLRILAINASDEVLTLRYEQFLADESFAYSRASTADYQGIISLFGILSFIYLYLGSIATKPFLEDKASGIKFRYKTMPLSTINFNFQSILAYFTPFFIIASFIFLAILTFTSASLLSVLAVFFATNLFGGVCITLAIMIYAFIDDFSLAVGIYSVLTTILGMLGGAFWPIAFLPKSLRLIANFNPVYWFMQAIEVIDGDFTNYLLSISIMVFMILVLILIPEIKKMRLKD